ncbi:MAG: hypothetical protein LQ342_006168 [Letrouitia transgressa]|nr:MAG: hypothetical protein LQ342_006168 [Letrouitia transgressa]
MEGTSPKDKLDSTYRTALTKNWMVWPWVQAANFTLVPLEHRVMVVNIVALEQDRGTGSATEIDQLLNEVSYLSILQKPVRYNVV